MLELLRYVCMNGRVLPAMRATRDADGYFVEEEPDLASAQPAAY